ncbi:TauD/TfdA family dioxygenase [Anderseniella sp. Alg231-50]|uniref:TauD/TfdA family dioxygenase n=1 Tax=Anderseniella sp. Alg231-50 TaxID=1922226 RepID=UPI000D54BB64
MSADQAIAIRRLTGNIGAEVTGIDLRDAISETAAVELRECLAQHQVVFFPDQHLDLQQQKMLTAIFGPALQLPYVTPMDAEPEIIRVYKGADEKGGVFGGDWHSDFSFLDAPPSGSVLSAHTLPPYGGDTLWASQAAAWDALPEALQRLLLGRDAIHVGKPYGVKWAPPAKEQSGAGIKMSRGDPTADRERKHPAVLQHPVTDRRMLYLNPTYVTRLDGMSEAESTPLLDQIQRHVTRPEFCIRHSWTPGTVAVWDNLATQHYAVNDYQGHERLMYRTTFSGLSPREMAAVPEKARQAAAE